MTDFICNVCGSRNHVAEFAAEPASCACGSNVRTRALIHLLSMELFGRNLILADFPRLKSVRALGMSDKECYASILQEKFDYRNTYYDREPRLDFSQPHGFLVATVPCSSGEMLREHYPDLHEYRILPLGGTPVLVNRRRDGHLEVTDELAFHGGSGTTLEIDRKSTR